MMKKKLRKFLFFIKSLYIYTQNQEQNLKTT